MTFEEQLNSEKNPAIIKIGNYLKDRAEIDPSVKRTIKKENKTLKDCWQYVIGEISKTIYRDGEIGIAAGDDQILYDLAVHYYDEDDIKIKKTDWVKINTNMGENQPKQEQNVKITKKTKKKKQPKDTTEEKQVYQMNLF